MLVVVFYYEIFLRTSKKGALMLTLFSSPKAIDYNKLINLNNVEMKTSKTLNTASITKAN